VNELELLAMFGKEGVTFVSIILVYLLFVKPKDKHIDELMQSNRQIVEDNGVQLGKISGTMEKISTEMVVLAENQTALKNGQDELWREVVRLKGEK
jgi:hypothetical protein